MTPFRTPEPFKHCLLCTPFRYPLFTLAIIVSSHFFHDHELLDLLGEHMNLILVVLGLTETLIEQVSKNPGEKILN